jgi:alkylation response protein AidB-like acyl-CoA dehydrogenase
MVEHPLTHVKMAAAAALVDQAEFHLYRSADTLDRSARGGTPMTDLERARLRADCAQAVKLSLTAVESLRTLLGGSGLGSTNPVYTALTDLQAMSVHGGLILDPALEVYGRVLTGYDPDSLAF